MCAEAVVNSAAAGAVCISTLLHSAGAEDDAYNFVERASVSLAQHAETCCRKKKSIGNTSRTTSATRGKWSV